MAMKEKNEAAEKETMTLRTFRIHDEDYNALKNHFKENGLNLASGLRMIIKQYMNDNNVS